MRLSERRQLITEPKPTSQPTDVNLLKVQQNIKNEIQTCLNGINNGYIGAGHHLEIISFTPFFRNSQCRPSIVTKETRALHWRYCLIGD